MNDIAVVSEPSGNYADPMQSVAPRPVFQPLASMSTQQVCGALAIAQGQFKAPRRTKEATVKGTTARGTPYEYTYKYAPLEELIEATKEGLAGNGLARQQYLATRGDQPIIRTIIWHSSGEWIASDYPIHPTKEGAQGFASGVTYARRYGLSLALGLAPEDDDDGALADTTDAPAKGKQPVRPRAPVPLQPPPETRPLEVFDPATGEVAMTRPHRIEVPSTPKGGRDWPVWGAKLIGAYGAAQTLPELHEWEALCADEIGEAKEHAPRVFKSTQGAWDKARLRLCEPPADFMPANESADISR